MWGGRLPPRSGGEAALRNPCAAPAAAIRETSLRMAQKPLELILARNLLTSLSTPAFLVDESGALIFYNEAAGALLGISFEEQGRMPAEEWSHAVGPSASDGSPIPIEELPTTKALRQGRPAHGDVHGALGEGRELRDRVDRPADRRRGRPGGGDDLLLATDERHTGCRLGAIRWGRREVMVRTR